MKKLILLLIPFLLNSAFSQEVFKFFEFAPRNTDYFILKNNKISQEFIPFNDYLSIIGLWLENPNQTQIKLSIFDSNNHLLFEKNFNIPVIEPNWWGEEYLLSLNDNLPLKSGEKYRIEIESQEDNNLKIFVKNLLEIIQGSENYLYFPETLKALTFNNEITNYTLKLSLYEGRETLPPVLTNLRVHVLSPFEVEIKFSANEPIKYSLSYKKNNDNDFKTVFIDYFIGCFPNIRDCSLKLDVQPESDYIFEIKAEDFWRNFSKLQGNFTTPKIREKDSSISSEIQTYSKSQTSFQESKSTSTFSNTNKKNLTEKMVSPLINSDQKKNVFSNLPTQDQISEISKDKESKIPFLEKTTFTKQIEQPDQTYNYQTSESKIIKTPIFSSKNFIFIPIFIFSLLIIFLFYKNYKK